MFCTYFKEVCRDSRPHVRGENLEKMAKMNQESLEHNSQISVGNCCSFRLLHNA